MKPLLALLLASLVSVSKTADPQAQTLYDDYFAWKNKVYPEFFSLKGYHDNDDKLQDLSPEGWNKFGTDCNSFLQRAKTMLDGGKLQLSDQHYVGLVRSETEQCVDGITYKGYLFSEMNFKSGVQKTLPSYFKKPGFFKLDTENDYGNVLKRLRAISGHIDGIISTLKDGVEAKMTFPIESLTRVKSQFDKLQVQNPEESAFYTPLKSIDSTDINDAAKQTIKDQAKAIIKDQVLPAYVKLDKYIHEVYMKSLRPNAGVWSVPNGKVFYQKCLEFHTSLKGITAQEVHDIGLRSMVELKKGVLKLAKDMGHGDKSFTEFMSFMRDSPDLKFKSREEALELLNNVLYDKINDRLPRILPAEALKPNVFKVDIAIPKSTGGTAYYTPPPLDGSRNGTFYINLNNLNNFQKSIVTTLTLHEANPGHHFQNVYNQASDFPLFVRSPVYYALAAVPSRPPVNTAHTEGWGLYSEYLGNDLGVFDDPIQFLGFYSYNLLRSARLVVDTGIHSFGWNRERAMKYILDNTAFSKSYVELQVDRYITWPGQATAYRMGERTIRKLREKKAKEEGDRFDLREFHVSYLKCQGPMDNLEKCMEIQKKIKEGAAK